MRERCLQSLAILLAGLFCAERARESAEAEPGAASLVPGAASLVPGAASLVPKAESAVALSATKPLDS